MLFGKINGIPPCATRHIQNLTPNEKRKDPF
jgi:hypothetical protein